MGISTCSIPHTDVQSEAFVKMIDGERNIEFSCDANEVLEPNAPDLPMCLAMADFAGIPQAFWNSEDNVCHFLNCASPRIAEVTLLRGNIARDMYSKGRQLCQIWLSVNQSIHQSTKQ